MKVGFAARWSPLDKKSWSGTCYYSFQEIRKKNEVVIFHYKWPWHLREWLTMQKSLNRRLLKKNTSVEFLKKYARYFSRQLQKDLEKTHVDLLFVSASPQLIAYLKTTIPIIFMIDATFQQIQGYYPYFSNLAGYNIRQGIELDKMAFKNATHCMLASEWSKNSAVNDYGIDENKISVVLCGANMDFIPRHEELMTYAPGRCRLLFLGTEWERKGGNIVLEIFSLLKQKGIDPHLHIIGCVPPHDLSEEENITIIPFLDKNKAEDCLQFQKIFQQTDFLLLPTRAECAGIAFSEASAYGIPSVTSDTGGVTSYIKEGINGYALSFTAGPGAYAEIILKLIADQLLLNDLKASSRQYYDSKLNWALWGKRFQEISEILVKLK